MFKTLIFIITPFLLFTGCGNNESNSNRNAKTHIVVGATPVPAAEILEFAKNILAQQGIEMSVRVFTDYITPDIALNAGELDANLYQHKPFMQLQNQNRGFSLEAISPIYVVPLGFYSKNFKSIDDIKDGAQIAIPSDNSNLARALILLHDNNVIELKDPKNPNATLEFDIAKNPKNLRFKPVEPSTLPRVFEQVDGAVINANYAIQAGMKIRDSIFHETKKSEYANVLAARQDNKNSEVILNLRDVLLSKEVAQWILKKYDGEILPITEF